jgi:hypothetical protein
MNAALSSILAASKRSSASEIFDRMTRAESGGGAGEGEVSFDFTAGVNPQLTFVAWREVISPMLSVLC